MQKKSAVPKRKSTRFSPEPGTMARVTFGKETKSKREFPALVVSESYGGCALVLANTPPLGLGNRLEIQVGTLAPLVAEVRWVIALDEHIYKAGFAYLEE